MASFNLSSYNIAGQSGGIAGLLDLENTTQDATIASQAATLTSLTSSVVTTANSLATIIPQYATYSNNTNATGNIPLTLVSGSLSDLSLSGAVFTKTTAGTTWFHISASIPLVSGQTNYALALFFTPSGGSQVVYAQVQDIKSAAPASSPTYNLSTTLAMNQGSSFVLYANVQTVAPTSNKGLVTILKI